MVRLQVSLTSEEHAAAKREARRLGISVAELLRLSLRHVLPVDSELPWMRYAGSVETRDASANQNIDELVYGRRD